MPGRYEYCGRCQSRSLKPGLSCLMGATCVIIPKALRLPGLGTGIEVSTSSLFSLIGAGDCATPAWHDIGQDLVI